MAPPTELRHAVFIEPRNGLEQAVRERKQGVAKRYPGAPYVDHPPHCTVWVGRVRDAGRAFASLQEAMAALPRPPGLLCRPHVFYDDALARNGQTCAFATDLGRELAQLQSIACESLVPFLAAETEDALPPGLAREPFIGSWKRYGYPFAGGHWVPHFTIAALPVMKHDPAVREFLASPSLRHPEIEAVSWWRIADGHHERMGWAPIGA
jgi:hypothetical protein